MAAGQGVVTKPSPYSVAESLDRLQAVLANKGIKVFSRIDQSAEAQAAGLALPPLQLLIFGNPKGGTPIMAAEPTAALDLPLKAIAWQDSAKQVWVSFNSPEYLQQRFQLAPDLVKAIAGVEALIDQALS